VSAKPPGKRPSPPGGEGRHRKNIQDREERPGTQMENFKTAHYESFARQENKRFLDGKDFAS